MRELYGGVSEQAKAGKHRFDDATALLAASRFRGAMYMAGYAVECLLKATLMKRVGVNSLTKLDKVLRERGLVATDSTAFTHHLESLLKWTGAFDRLQQDSRRRLDFTRVNGWTPAWRYSANSASRAEAQEFLNAIQRLRQWIENNV